MEKIMNEENKWDQMVETDVVEGPVEKVARNEIVKATRKMKLKKAIGPSEEDNSTTIHFLLQNDSPNKISGIFHEK